MELLSKEKEVVGIYISGHPLDDYKFEIGNFCNTELSLLKNLYPLLGKELRFSGIVTQVEHKETKNGKKYGVLYLEDYRDNFRFFIFGNDYVRLKAYFNESWLLFIKGKVEKRPYNDEQVEFRIKKIELLSELTDKEDLDIVIELSLDDITDELIDQILSVTEKNKGKHSLILQINNHDDKYGLELLSRKKKLDISKDLVDEIKKISGLELKVSYN